MKFLLIGLVSLGAISANAGQINNSETGEAIVLKSVGEIVNVELKSNEGIVIKQFSYKGFQHNIKEGTDLVANGRNWPGYKANGKDIFLFTSLAIEDEFYYLAPALVFPLAVDLVTMPVRLPLKLIGKGNAKKDIKILNSAINSDEAFEVSISRFKRIKEYLNL